MKAKHLIQEQFEGDDEDFDDKDEILSLIRPSVIWVGRFMDGDSNTKVYAGTSEEDLNTQLAQHIRSTTDLSGYNEDLVANYNSTNRDNGFLDIDEVELAGHPRGSVWIADIDHHGSPTFVAGKTYAAAIERLADWCREQWADDGAAREPLPGDAESAVRTFFHGPMLSRRADDVTYTITHAWLRNLNDDDLFSRTHD